MKSIKYSFVVATALITTSPAFAQGGSNAGNGGIGVVCFDTTTTAAKVKKIIIDNRLLPIADRTYPLGFLKPEQIQSVRMLDYYQAQMPDLDDNINLIEYPSDWNYKQIIQERLALLEKTNYFFYKKVKQYESIIPFDRIQGSEGGLLELDDSNAKYLLLPNCLRLQIGYQFEAPDKKYDVYYDRMLLAKMSAINRATLVLHEWIFRWMKNELNARDSYSTRVALGFILRKDLGPNLLYPSIAALLRMGYPAHHFGHFYVGEVRYDYYTPHPSANLAANAIFLQSADFANWSFSLEDSFGGFVTNPNTRFVYRTPRLTPFSQKVLVREVRFSYTHTFQQGNRKVSVNPIPHEYEGITIDDSLGFPAGTEIAVNLDSDGTIISITPTDKLTARTIMIRGTLLHCDKVEYVKAYTVKSCLTSTVQSIQGMTFKGNFVFTEDGYIDLNQSQLNREDFFKE